MTKIMTMGSTVESQELFDRWLSILGCWRFPHECEKKIGCLLWPNNGPSKSGRGASLAKPKLRPFYVDLACQCRYALRWIP
jgi:hypothetical protein